jgi:hypothetical protein
MERLLDPAVVAEHSRNADHLARFGEFADPSGLVGESDLPAHVIDGYASKRVAGGCAKRALTGALT